MRVINDTAAPFPESQCLHQLIQARAAAAVAAPERIADRAEAEGIQARLLAAGVALHRPPHPAVGHLLRITAHPAALSEDVLAVLQKP